MPPSRYESQKRRDWLTFGHYLRNHRPPLELRRCSGAHVLEFLRYLDRFGKTRVHDAPCPAYGNPAGTESCSCQCPLRQAWGSLDALVGRLRAAYDERHRDHGNPFAARAVRLYLREVRDAQAVARGISYTDRRKKRNKRTAKPSADEAGTVLASEQASSSSLLTAPELAGCCDLSNSSSFLLGKGGASSAGGGACPAAACCNGAFYLPPLLFNSFGY